MQTLSDRVRIALELSGLSQVALAKCCGLTEGAVSQWISGETKNLKGRSAILAASCLNVNALWLVEGKGQMGMTSRKELADLIEASSGLSKEKIDALTHIARVMSDTQ